MRNPLLARIDVPDLLRRHYDRPDVVRVKPRCQRRFGEGDCHKCGRRKATPPFVTCAPCRKASREYQRAAYHKQHPNARTYPIHD